MNGPRPAVWKGGHHFEGHGPAVQQPARVLTEAEQTEVTTLIARRAALQDQVQALFAPIQQNVVNAGAAIQTQINEEQAKLQSLRAELQQARRAAQANAKSLFAQANEAAAKLRAEQAPELAEIRQKLQALGVNQFGLMRGFKGFRPAAMPTVNTEVQHGGMIAGNMPGSLAPQLQRVDAQALVAQAAAEQAVAL